MKLSVLIYGTIGMCITASLLGMQPAPKPIVPVDESMVPTAISITPLPAEKKTYLAKNIIYALELGRCYACYANDDITLAQVAKRPQGNCCCNYQRYKTSSIRYPCCSDHISKRYHIDTCKLTPGAEFTLCSCCGLCCLDSHGRCMFITCGRKDLSEADYAKQSFNSFCCFSAMVSIGILPAMFYCCPEPLILCCDYCDEHCDEYSRGEWCRNCTRPFFNCCDACCKENQTSSTQSNPPIPLGAIYYCCCL